MAVGFENWFLIFYALLLTCGLGNGVREISKQNHMHAHLSSHMDHMEASKNGFFTLKDLYVGKRMPITFSNINFSSSPHFLPREEADLIPFSSAELPNLLNFFSISLGSTQAKAMAETIRICELHPIKGETKFCATSLESMLQFVCSIFGSEAPFKVLTNNFSKSSTLLENYTILEEPKEISASYMVACHPMAYPHAVFYCHTQRNGNKVFTIVLGSEDGNRVEAISVCHMDTSEWNPDHISFRLLGFKPGTSPVCHFFSASGLVWVSSSPPTD